MKKHIIAAFAISCLPAVAAACPDYNQSGATYSLNAGTIGGGVQYAVTAGGDNYLPDCGFKMVEAYVMTAPDFTLDMSGFAGRSVTMSVVSQCDSAMIVNNTDAKWYYDDDSNGDLDPRITLPGSDGYLDVWIGTYDGQYCDAALTITMN